MNELEDVKYAYIHSLKLADILVNEGYRCLGKKINVQNPRFVDFIFEDGPGVREIIDSYTRSRHTEQLS